MRRERAEFDAFEVFFDDTGVAGRQKVEVTGAEVFVTIRVAHPHSAFDDVAPVRTRAEIVGQALQQRPKVGARWQRDGNGTQIAPVGGAEGWSQDLCEFVA